MCSKRHSILIVNCFFIDYPPLPIFLLPVLFAPISYHVPFRTHNINAQYYIAIKYILLVILPPHSIYFHLITNMYRGYYIFFLLKGSSNIIRILYLEMDMDTKSNRWKEWHGLLTEKSHFNAILFSIRMSSKPSSSNLIFICLRRMCVCLLPNIP